MELKILFEDNHLLAVEKPAGVLSQPDISGEKDLSEYCKDYLKTKYEKPGAVYLGTLHRLDRSVSGVTLFAKTSKAVARLAEQFRNHTIGKTYHAVTIGRPSPPEGERTDWIEKDENQKIAILSAGRGEGRKAVLFYKYIRSISTPASFKIPALMQKRELCLLEIRMQTGRFHQIRFQLAYHGNPILGDTKYGSPIRLPDHGLALRCIALEFEHPVKKERMRIESPDPPDWPWG